MNSNISNNKEWEKKYKAGIGSASGVAEALKEEVAQMTEKLRREGERAKAADARAAKLAQDLAQREDDLDDLRATNTKLEKEKRLLQVEKEDLEEDLVAAEAKLATANAAEGDPAAAAAVAKQQQAEEMKGLTARFERERAGLLKEKSELETQVAQLRENAKNAERGRDKAASELQKTCDELGQTVSRLERENKALLVDKEGREAQLKQLAANVQRLEAQLLADGSDKQAAAATALAQLQQAKEKEAEAHKAALRSAQEESGKAKAEMQREIDELKARLASVEAESARAREGLQQKADSEKQQLRDELEALKKQKQQQQAQQAPKQQQQQQQTNEPREAEEKARLEAENARLAKEVDELRARLADEPKTPPAVGGTISIRISLDFFGFPFSFGGASFSRRWGKRHRGGSGLVAACGSQTLSCASSPPLINRINK
jgi:chromosome segregation ATPase